ncbi:MAG TPA: hypothetical protein VFN61_03465, partial [Acidimicrobiales bacterium]|nr:hypothetical protein [Acidimicrobiales bacterium]
MATKRHSIRTSRPRRRRWRYLLAIPGLVLAIFVWTLIGAALTPGNQSLAAKWADYLRANHMGLVAQKFEEVYYSATAPSAGGRPKGLNKVPSVVGAPVTTTTSPQTRAKSPASTTSTTSSTTTTTAPPGLPAPQPVPLVVSPALPGEGQWQPTGPLVKGRPAMYVAQFRADDIYTSQITSAVWVDTKLLKIQLVPGSTEPGGTWSHPPYVTPAELPYLVAAFNGGFRFQDARGGIYLEGKQGVPLVNGAASLVVYKDGRVAIGSWGSQVSMSPSVVSVLQNVVLLVDHGKLAPSATYTDNAIWGYTLGGGFVVPRSGIGVT